MGEGVNGRMGEEEIGRTMSAGTRAP